VPVEAVTQLAAQHGALGDTEDAGDVGGRQ
jgi:hypothetical protein